MTGDILSLACVLVPSAFAWDAFRRWSALSYGRLLAADKQLALERQVTAVHTLCMQHAETLDRLLTRLSTTEEHVSTLRANFQTLSAAFGTVEQRSENTTASVAAFINETRDQIEGLRQRETMALAGLNAIGRKGIRTGTP